MATTAEARLTELNITLPPPGKPMVRYKMAVVVGNMLYVSGHGPAKINPTTPVTGRCGADLTVEQGKEAALAVGLAILATVRDQLGSLDRVKRVVKSLGMVNSTPEFLQHPAVINGFSDLMAEVFGDDRGVGAEPPSASWHCPTISPSKSSVSSRSSKRTRPLTGLAPDRDSLDFSGLPSSKWISDFTRLARRCSFSRPVCRKNSGMAGKLVGIDLGTTFSAIATLDDHGQPFTLPNRDGEMLTPSAVLLLDDGSRRRRPGGARRAPSNSPTASPRSSNGAWAIRRFGRPVAGRDFRPETLSAIILRKLVQDAELRIGPISKAVITVPAYFDDTRRKATKDAGRIAGLDVLDILDEPTAAALAYSFQPPPALQRHRRPRPCSPRAADRPRLRPRRRHLRRDAGAPVAAALPDAGHRGRRAPRRQGLGRPHRRSCRRRSSCSSTAADPRTDPQSLATLQAAAERAKRTLSKLPQTTITCTHAGKVLTVPLTPGRVREPDARPARPHAADDAAGAAPGRADLGPGRSRAAGRRLDAHADDRGRCCRS